MITRPATAASNEWLARGSACASPTLKLARGSATCLAREGDEAVGRIDAGHLTRRCVCKDDFAQGAGAAAYIDPIAARRHAEPVHELPGNETAPAADIGLIGVAAGPCIFSFRNHATSLASSVCSNNGGTFPPKYCCNSNTQSEAGGYHGRKTWGEAVRRGFWGQQP